MGAPCKLRSSKPGKGTQQTLVLLKRHSIIVRGATAKRGSANTRKRWKPRKPHNPTRKLTSIAPAASGEHRPPACRSRQLAETGQFRRYLRITCAKGVAGSYRLAACAPQS